MSYFDQETLLFFRDLSANNRTEWFRANKDRYEAVLREPYRQLLADLAEPLAQVAPNFFVDQRKVGGSLFRIQRNTRFSPDKSPYNDWLGARFLRRGAFVDHTGELFMKIAPDGRSEVGAGIAFPSSSVLGHLRSAIADEEKNWLQLEITLAKYGYRFVGKSLQKGPRGFAAEHPNIEALKRQACAVVYPLTDAQICSDELVPLLIDHFERLLPLLDWQHQALGHTPARAYQTEIHRLIP